MFVSSQPPSIAMTVSDMDALRSLMRTSNPQSEVAEFVAHELGRADRIEGAGSMLDYVTIGSWVLFRLDRSGEVRFTKLELSNAGPTNTHADFSDNGHWRGADRTSPRSVNRVADARREEGRKAYSVDDPSGSTLATAAVGIGRKLQCRRAGRRRAPFAVKSEEA